MKGNISRYCLAFFGFIMLHSYIFAGDGYIQAGNLKIYYEETGTGDALVFLHAGGLDHRMWDKQVEYFNRKYRVITIDQPAHGQTSGQDTGLQQQEVIRVVLDCLHVSRAAIIGSSLGAVCALDFALKYPDRVNKLVLVSPGLNGWWEVLTPDSLSKALLEHQAHSDSLAGPAVRAKEMVDLWCIGPFRQQINVDAEILHYSYQTTLFNFMMKDRSAPVWNPDRAVNHLSELTLPLLIIYGKLDLPLTTLIANYIHLQVRHSTVISLPNVAHLLSMEIPARFDKIVGRFLED